MSKSDAVKKKLMALAEEFRKSGAARLPAERVLAGRLGCSRSTVVKVLNDLESEGFIERKVGSGTYLKSPDERSRQICIAVVMRNIFYRSDEHFRKLLDEISRLARERGIAIRIFDNVRETFPRDPAGNPLVSAIGKHEIHGVLIISRLPLSITSALCALSPTVAVNNIFGDGSEVPCVSCDYFRTGFLAGKYLIDRGHRKVAYVTDDLTHQESSVEFSGFQAVLETAGVSLSERDILETRQNSEIMKERIITFFKNSGYTACFMRNAARVANMMLALKSGGIRCPEDLEIVVSGNYGNYARHRWSLAVIDTRLDDMCRIGLERLSSLIAGRPVHGRNLTLLTPHFVEE
ncbi:MAG: LacI family DNA-binding transcriptional regulator [Lentisphaeria bacterium]|nr:LacI family DNA-binding transcriptional regulator [Lentisphaeria bacterium]